MADLGELVVKIVGDNAQFIKQLDESQKRMGAVSDVFIGLGKQMTAAVTFPILGIGAAFVKTASDAEETNSKFNAVFKEQSDSVRDWAEEFSDSVNRATIDNIGFLATIQDTLVPLGFARDNASEMSKAVVELATDLASFNNLPTADVVRDIQSAIVGNTETLRKYGVVASQDAIIQEALTSGLIENKKELDANTKAQAIYQLLIKGTADAQGDAVRTADSFANQLKGLQASATDLATEFGNELLPAISDIVKNITDVIKWFTDLDEGTKKIIITFAGVAAATGPLLTLFGSLTKALVGAGTASSSLLGPLGLVIAAITTLNAISDQDNFMLVNGLKAAAADAEITKEELIKISEASGLTTEELIEQTKNYKSINDLLIAQKEAQDNLNRAGLVALEQIGQEAELRAAILNTLGAWSGPLENLFAQIEESNQAIQEFHEELTEEGSEDLGNYGEKLEEITRGLLRNKEAYDILEETATNGIKAITGVIEEESQKQEKDASKTIEKLTQEYIDMFEEVESRAKEMYANLEQWTGTYFDILGETIAKGKLDWDSLKDALKETVVALLKALSRELFIRGLQLIALPFWLGGNKARGAALIAASAAARIAAGVVAALQEGGIVNPTPGGTIARIGEGGVQEAVIPLRQDVLGDLGAQIAANIRPETNIFNNTNNQFPSQLMLSIDGQEFNGYLTQASQDGLYRINPKSISKR